MKPTTSGSASPTPRSRKTAAKKAEEATKLASAVDFVAAHILPYWEGAPVNQVVERTILTYNKLRARHPGKRIVIAEFGWPSAGYNHHDANPGRIEQATVLRDFISRADAYGIDYNIIEAFDQPWKTNEGSVGMYWGVFDAAREAKFAWAGPVHDLDHWKFAGLAVLLGLLLSLPILARRSATAGEAATLAIAANVVGAWFATVFAFWQTHYFVLGAAFALGLGIVLLIPLVAIALGRIEEIAAIAFGRGPRRLIATALSPVEGFAPKVSIHVPAFREPPEMLKATLDSVARLDYPNFECVVVINNTPDPAFWRPIEDHCAALGERFKFVNQDNVSGYKAGALRLALAHTADDAEIIAVIDADYVVQPNWLKDLVPAFADAEGRDGPGAAGPSRRRTHRHASRHERRICRLLRHRHGPAQRGQRRHRARHHVPDPPRGARLRRRLVERHHRRGFRSRPARARAGLANPLHQSALWPRSPARYLRRLQAAALSLGLRRPADSAQALEPSPAPRRRP